MTKQEAVAKISELMDKAGAIVSECECIAEEHNINFHCNLGGYGMGGFYSGSDAEWNASSQSC